MKKKILSAVIAGVMFVATSLPIVAYATPNEEVEQARSEYQKFTDKINELNEKIQVLDAEISPIVDKMNKNEAEIDTINNEIDNTNKEIEQAKVEITDQEDVLGSRLREVYKSGGQTSYLSVIFSSDSLSDLISNISSTKKVVEIDQSIVEDLNKKKEKLDEKVDSLEDKSEQIDAINNQLKEQKEELDKKKDEQQVLLNQAKSQQEEYNKKYLAPAEREIVQALINNCKNSNNSKDVLQSNIDQLRAIRDGQLKSDIVKKEVNAAIEEAKVYVKQKEQQEQAAAQQAAAQQAANRGDVTYSGSASAVINEAYKHIGKWYEYGATGPNTFDCSGFTQYVYRVATGIDITRTTYTQINVGRPVSQSELQPGDLVFPHTGHVGIYVGNGLMIHAPQTGDRIKVAPVYKFYAARRILN